MSRSFGGGSDPRGVAARTFSAKSALANSTACILRAMDVEGNQAELHVVGIRHNTSRDIRANILLDIHPVAGRTVFGLNPTNIMRLQDLVGDDLSQVVGKILTVGKFDYGGEFGDGLQILRVDEPETESGRNRKGK